MWTRIKNKADFFFHTHFILNLTTAKSCVNLVQLLSNTFKTIKKKENCISCSCFVVVVCWHSKWTYKCHLELSLLLTPTILATQKIPPATYLLSFDDLSRHGMHVFVTSHTVRPRPADPSLGRWRGWGSVWWRWQRGFTWCHGRYLEATRTARSLQNKHKINGDILKVLCAEVCLTGQLSLPWKTIVSGPPKD